MSTEDLHHIAGESNSPETIRIPVNDHLAELSTAQYGWPKATLENPDQSPLLATAGCIRGATDTIVYLVVTFLAWVVVMLEELDRYLGEKLGLQWWRGTAIEQWEPQ